MSGGVVFVVERTEPEAAIEVTAHSVTVTTANGDVFGPYPVADHRETDRQGRPPCVLFVAAVLDDARIAYRVRDDRGRRSRLATIVLTADEARRLAPTIDAFHRILVYGFAMRL